MQRGRWNFLPASAEEMGDGMVAHQDIFCFCSLIPVMSYRQGRAATRITDSAERLQKRKRTQYKIRCNGQQDFSFSAECLCHQRMESDAKSRVPEDPTVGNSCLGHFWCTFTLGLCLLPGDSARGMDKAC